MKNSVIAAVIATAATVSQPAFAQDAEPSNTHIYAGVVAGYDSVELSTLGVSADQGDIMYGILAGIDTTAGDKAVLGLEAELSDSQVSDSVSDIDVVGDRARISAGRDIYVGVRGGFAWARMRLSTPRAATPTSW